MKKTAGTGTGWVLKTKGTGVYYTLFTWRDGDIYTKNISEAHVWPTRDSARENKMDHEKVVKVRVMVEEV